MFLLAFRGCGGGGGSSDIGIRFCSKSCSRALLHLQFNNNHQPILQQHCQQHQQRQLQSSQPLLQNQQINYLPQLHHVCYSRSFLIPTGKSSCVINTSMILPPIDIRQSQRRQPHRLCSSLLSPSSLSSIQHRTNQQPKTFTNTYVQNKREIPSEVNTFHFTITKSPFSSVGIGMNTATITPTIIATNAFASSSCKMVFNSTTSIIVKVQSNQIQRQQIRTFANRRHKRILQYTKGYRGRSKNCFSIAIRRLHKAWQYAYRDRKTKKRIWRTLWIQRIQAGVRQYNVRYSRFIRSLSYCNIHLNRKVLSELAATEPFTFKAIIDVTQHQQEIYNYEQRTKLINDMDNSEQISDPQHLAKAA